ncbi:Na+/H+ antiporter subunit E [Geodermatophilus sp. SYSU D00815]
MTGRPAPARWGHHLPPVLWLVLVWMLLWGTWSWANLLSGLLLALVVTRLLPLPPEAGGLRFRPWPALVYAVRFLVDVVASCAQVVWLAFRPGRPRGAIIAVQARTDNDLLLTILAETVCLIPGSIVVELDRDRRVLGLHLLDARDAATVEAQKQRVLAEEERIVRAFGGPEDLARLGLSPDLAEAAAGLQARGGRS